MKKLFPWIFALVLITSIWLPANAEPDVPEENYNPAIGVIVTNPYNIYETLIGGATLIDQDTIQSAAHVLQYVRIRHLYFVYGCRNIKNCTDPIVRQIVKVHIFDDPDSDWEAVDPVDIAIETLKDPINTTKLISLPSYDMAWQDPVLVRGNGCKWLGGTSAEVQQEAVLHGHRGKQGSEIYFQDPSPSKPAICQGDSGSFWGIQTPDSYVQIGVVTRIGINISVAESIWDYKSRIEDCMDGFCPERVLVTPAVGLQNDTYSVFPGQKMYVGSPGLLWNDQGAALQLVSPSCWDIGDNDSSTLMCASNGAFQFDPGYLNIGQQTSYGYRACDDVGICADAQVTFQIVEEKLLFLPLIVGD